MEGVVKSKRSSMTEVTVQGSVFFKKELLFFYHLQQQLNVKILKKEHEEI